MQGVTLASLHAAKGLEWDAVFLVGLTDGSLPITHAIKAGVAAIEEERRLFYVGVTRARKHLFHSWSAARQEGGRHSRKRTRFLDDIIPETNKITTAKPAKRHQRPARCKVCGSPLVDTPERILGRCNNCPSDADPQIFETLRVWRAGVAKTNNIPAYIVFSDATLQAIAEALPTNTAELLKINGIGQVKVERYGQDLLETVAQFLDDDEE